MDAAVESKGETNASNTKEITRSHLLHPLNTFGQVEHKHLSGSMVREKVIVMENLKDALNHSQKEGTPVNR